MKKQKRILLISFLFFLTVAATHATPLQTGFSDYDLLSNSIFPYFSHLYDKKLSSTFLFFPDWKENSEGSLLKTGKKDRYGTFYDLYFTGQYSGSPNIIGMHIDRIQIQAEKDSANDSPGTDINRHHKYDNRGRAGIWYSINGLEFFRGVSCICNFSHYRDDTFKDSPPDYNKSNSKSGSFHGRLISQYKLFKTGIIRLYMQYTQSSQRKKELHITAPFDTSYSNSHNNLKYSVMSLGYLLNNPKTRNTFFAGIGYSAAFSNGKSIHEWNGPDSTYDREISSVSLEAYDAQKLSVEKLDIYLGVGGAFQYYLYVFDKGNLSFFDKIKEYNRDYTEYRSYLFFPLFLEYKITQNLALFSSWKPSVIRNKYLFTSNAGYAERKESQLNFSDASLGMILTIKEKFHLTLVPDFSENLKLSGIEASLSF